MSFNLKNEKCHLKMIKNDHALQALFSENSFSEELASYWFLTRYVTSFFR